MTALARIVVITLLFPSAVFSQKELCTPEAVKITKESYYRIEMSRTIANDLYARADTRLIDKYALMYFEFESGIRNSIPVLEGAVLSGVLKKRALAIKKCMNINIPFSVKSIASIKDLDSIKLVAQPFSQITSREPKGKELWSPQDLELDATVHPFKNLNYLGFDEARRRIENYHIYQYNVLGFRHESNRTICWHIAVESRLYYTLKGLIDRAQ